MASTPASGPLGIGVHHRVRGRNRDKVQVLSLPQGEKESPGRPTGHAGRKRLAAKRALLNCEGRSRPPRSAEKLGGALAVDASNTARCERPPYPGFRRIQDHRQTFVWGLMKRDKVSHAGEMRERPREVRIRHYCADATRRRTTSDVSHPTAGFRDESPRERPKHCR